MLSPGDRVFDLRAYERGVINLGTLSHMTFASSGRDSEIPHWHVVWDRGGGPLIEPYHLALVDHRVARAVLCM